MQVFLEPLKIRYAQLLVKVPLSMQIAAQLSLVLAARFAVWLDCALVAQIIHHCASWRGNLQSPSFKSKVQAHSHFAIKDPISSRILPT